MLNQTADVVSASRNRLHAMFFGMENYAVVMNRTYLITVTDHMVSGANVIGLASAPTSQEGVDTWRNPFLRISGSTIRKYEKILPEMPEFLAANSANFQIKIRDIAEVSFKAKKKAGMGAIPHCGSMIIKTTDGKKRDFAVIGEVDGQGIEQKILSLRDRPPATFLETNDVVLESYPPRIKVLLCTIGNEIDFDRLLQEDRAHYDRMPAEVSVFQFGNVAGFLEGIKDRRVDIIHMFAKFDSDTGIDGHPTQELIQHIQRSNAKLVLSAYGNREILKNVSGINMLMTIDRNGDGFSRFCTKYFDQLVHGNTILQAYAQIVPQNPHAVHDFDAVFIPAGGDYKFYSTNLLEKLYLLTMNPPSHLN